MRVLARLDRSVLCDMSVNGWVDEDVDGGCGGEFRRRNLFRDAIEHAELFGSRMWH